ncbi:MAG TPA: homoserine kinase [Candidatus Dormibacteraeota bacterium]|nr:homoserine kinase [Candidatus Dormibacteraeota bacterium]
MEPYRAGPGVLEVVVPATSANLGCAFDCAALAINLQLTVEATPLATPGFEVNCQGEGSAELPRDESNLVAQGIRRLAAWSRCPTPGLRLQLHSEIPVGAGLGSSAAAIVAGLLIGTQLFPTTPDDATLIGLAAELDGHPDNVAAAYLGGLVVSAGLPGSGRVLTRKAIVPTGLELVVVIPDRPLPTSKARSVLPDTYSRADAVHNMQRASLLVASAFSGEFDFEPEFFADRWHQTQRGELMPGLRECLELEYPGLLGVFLSGAGSSVLAMTKGAATEVADQLVARFRAQGVGARALVLMADNEGAKGRRLEEPSRS